MAALQFAQGFRIGLSFAHLATAELMLTARQRDRHREP